MTHKVGINTVKVKGILPHGSIKMIANRSKTSPDTVRRVLEGKSKNTSVVISLKDYICELNDVNNKISEGLKELQVAYS